jgi:hypothetical protein
MTESNTTVSPPAAAVETAVNPSPVLPSCKWPRLGLAAVALWLLLFATGVLVDSALARERLGWKPQSDHTASTPKENPQTQEDIGSNPQAKAKLENSGKPATSLTAHAGPRDFLVAMFSFAPLNIGFLCIMAAFIGGCAVNKNDIDLVRARIAALPPGDDTDKAALLRRRLNYLTEHPGYSAIRGLVVYIILISGLFVLGSSPQGAGDSQSLDLNQYMRLAGLFSFFSYIAGSDPTVFSSLLNIGSNRLRPQNPDPPANS